MAQPDSLRRIFGLALNVDAYGRGGFWRGKSTIFCSGSNDTKGEAEATAEGEIRFTYNASANTPDRIIIRSEPPPGILFSYPETLYTHWNPVTKSFESFSHTVTLREIPFTVSGPKGDMWFLDTLNDNTIVDLDQPGPYTIKVKLHTSAGGGGGCPDCGSKTHQDRRISIQSVRDALSLGYSDASSLDQSFTFPLPIFVKSDALRATLDKKLFNADGRWYPCGPKDSCYSEAGDIYLVDPKLEIEGAWIILKVHLDGRIHGPLFTSIHTYGDLVAYGVPAVENNIVELQKVSFEAKSDDWVFNTISSRFHDKVLSLLQSRAQYDLNPLLQEEEAKLNGFFPVPWGSVCLTVDFGTLALSSVIPQTSPEGITANFRVGIKLLQADKCILDPTPAPTSH